MSGQLWNVTLLFVLLDSRRFACVAAFNGSDVPSHEAKKRVTGCVMYESEVAVTVDVVTRARSSMLIVVERVVIVCLIR